MRFAASQWLWVLLAFPVFYYLLVLDEGRRKAQFSRFADPALWQNLAPEASFGARLKKARIWLLAMAFGVLALARPQWGTHEEVARMTGLDIMFALDVSNSMEVEDVVPSRLKKAKHVIRTITERLEGDRVGALAFAGSAYVACPLTTDLEYLLQTVEILGPKSILNQGTDLATALETASRSLDRGAEEADAPNPAKGSGEANSSSRVVILITDGEDNEGRAVEAVGKLKASGTRLFVLGVGTEKGGPIPVRDENGQLHGYKKDQKGQPVVSTFQPNTLVQLAAAAGGRYWSVTPSEQEVDEIIDALGGLSRGEYDERRYLVYEDRFQYPLFLAVLLLFIELTIPVRRSGKTRGAGLAAGVAIFIFAPKAFAVPMDAYIENERGIQAFKEGKVDEAKQKFGAAQARDPSLPELEYNQGTVKLKEGDVDGAITSFQQAARGALREGNQEVVSRSLFNLGVAQTKKGDFKNAIRSYLGAIGSAKKSQDKDLEADARKNLELIRREEEKQKQQQQQQDQQNQQSNNQDQQNQQNQQQNKQQNQQGQNKDQKDQQGNNDQKNPPQPQQSQGKDRKKQNFQSQKLSREDADRVMAELKNREKELERKLRKQNGKPQTQNNPKDW